MVPKDVDVLVYCDFQVLSDKSYSDMYLGGYRLEGELKQELVLSR